MAIKKGMLTNEAIYKAEVWCYGKEIPVIDILNALTEEEIEDVLVSVAESLAQEGRI